MPVHALFPNSHLFWSHFAPISLDSIPLKPYPQTKQLACQPLCEKAMELQTKKYDPLPDMQSVIRDVFPSACMNHLARKFMSGIDCRLAINSKEQSVLVIFDSWDKGKAAKPAMSDMQNKLSAIFGRAIKVDVQCTASMPLGK